MSKKNKKNKENIIIVRPAGKGPPKQQSADVPVPPVKNEIRIVAGYSVGLKEDGTFVWNILGSAPGFAELIGLHFIAEKKLEELYHAKVTKGKV